MPTEEADIDMAEPDDLDVNPFTTSTILAAVPGIKVLPKAKAKHYENSVSSFCMHNSMGLFSSHLNRTHRWELGSNIATTTLTN